MKKLFVVLALGMLFVPEAQAWYNAGGWNTGVGMGWGRHGVRPYVSTGYNFAPRRERVVVEPVYVPVAVQVAEPYYGGNSGGSWQYEPAYQEETVEYGNDTCCDPLIHHSTIRDNNGPKPHQPVGW